MLSQDLIDQLQAIAYCEVAKPDARVAALASLARNSIDIEKVRATLTSIGTDAATPDRIKVRAIDLLDKFDTPEKHIEIAEKDIQATADALMRKYAGDT